MNYQECIVSYGDCRMFATVKQHRGVDGSLAFSEIEGVRSKHNPELKMGNHMKCKIWVC